MEKSDVGARDARAPPGAAEATITDPNSAPLAPGATSTPPAPASAPSTCKYKHCKHTAKGNEEASTLYPCSIATCGNNVHGACLAQLRDEFCVEGDFDETICGKRCYNAAKKRASVAPSDPNVKRRVSWHSDGLTPSVSSMSCLLDWMTSGSNCSKYRGGEGQHGETKDTLAGEISRFINECGVPTVRTSKSIKEKIKWLEDTLKEASRWLECTGAGVTDESSIREAVTQRCLYYYELEDIMKDRPSVRPLLCNTDERFRNPSVSPPDPVQDSSGGSTPTTPTQSDVRAVEGTRDDTQADLSRARDGAGSNLSGRPASTPLSVASQPGSRKRVSVEPHPAFLDLKHTEAEEAREFKRMKLELREQEMDIRTQEMQIMKRKAATERKESEVRIQATAAKAEELRQEAEHWRIQARASLLRERKKLLDDGVHQRDIGALLPLGAALEKEVE